jgi:hypothetical protein
LRIAEAFSKIQKQSADLSDIDGEPSQYLLSAFALVDKTFYAINHTVGACAFSIGSNTIFQHYIAADFSSSAFHACFASPLPIASSIGSIDDTGWSVVPSGCGVSY